MSGALSYALRQVRRSPALAIAATLTLAIGIGASVAVFEVLDSVVFRALPVRDPASLVRVQLVENGKPRDFSYSLFRDMAARQQVASGIFATSDYPLHAAVLSGRGELRTVNAVLVTDNYFSVLGVAAQAGRIFTVDDQPASGPVAVISDRFWQSEFGRSAGALGARLQINQAVVSIVGVAPAGFSGEVQGNAPDVWLPMSAAPLAMATDWTNAPRSIWLTVMARLLPGVSPGAASLSLEALLHEVGEQRAGVEYRVGIQPASRGISQLRGRFQSPLLVLMAATGMLLLIACCNLANLLLGRAAARTREIGIRLALGAGRPHLVRHLLLESFVFALPGAAASLPLSRWGARVLVALATQGHDWQIPIEWNWRVTLFGLVVTTAAACLFGLAPALLAAQVELNPALQGTAPGVSGGRHVFGKLLVVAQISISVVLLSGSALLVRSLWSLTHQDFGYHANGVLVAQLPWEFSRTMMARYAALRQPLYDRMNRLPGVQSAALACFGPMGGDQHTGPLASPERPSQPGDNPKIVHVSPRYFETMGIPIVSGRGIGEEDRADAPAVAVLSETAAHSLFPAANAVGRLVSQEKQFDSGHAIQVVGIARDVRFAGPADSFGFVIYVPMTQSPAPITAVILRTSGDPAGLAPSLRAAMNAVDPGLAVGAIRPLQEMIDASLGDERILAVLASCFGVLALALTCVGVYGVMSYAVERRRREIGIRLALGARQGQVAGGILGEAMLLGAASVVLGCAVGFAATRALRALLFGFSPADYALLAGAGAVLLMASALAAFLPARRAAGMDPMSTMREA